MGRQQNHTQQPIPHEVATWESGRRAYGSGKPVRLNGVSQAHVYGTISVSFTVKRRWSLGPCHPLTAGSIKGTLITHTK